jgi:hypothetical protein
MNAHMIVGRGTALLVSATLLLPACDAATPVSLTSPEPSAAIVPAAPILMDYVKVETGPGSLNWLGSVSGDVIGALETRVVGASQSGHILHIQTKWSVDAGAESFEADLDGTLDTKTGRLLLDGAVMSGYLAGARVHDEGQLTGTDPSTSGSVFEGFLRIMPGSAS